MVLNYDLEIADDAINTNLNKLINQVYKLLPNREENSDWQKPLQTIIIEFAGMSRLFLDHQDSFFALLCKLEGLKDLTEEYQFLKYRSTIFECINLISSLKVNNDN